MKICSICKSNLPEESYYKDKSRKDGLNPRCKTCKSQLDKKYRETNKQVMQTKQAHYYRENQDKIKERSNKWYQENTDKHKERMTEYFQENKEKIKEKQKEWNQRNKEKMRVYINDYIQRKYKEDVNYKVKCILNSRIRSLVRKNTNSSSLFIGCSLDYFKNWIEYQFDDKMSWDNCGSYWHFDHVKPCASFDLSNEEDILQCFSWKNIRPLEAISNISKGCKVFDNVIQQHNLLVESFITRRTKEQ